jgi:outer membrane autotransporter protein
MTSRRTALRALAIATALTAYAAPAAAQRVDRIVAFGDSYADDDNLRGFLGGAFPAPGNVYYPTGRFSGGTNYIDTLATILDVPVDNFAIGGALTNNTNTNSPALPGFTTEVNSFLTGGAGATPFPAVDGTFGPNDLLTLSIGGNDGRVYQKSGGTVAGAPAAGVTASANATANLDRLVAAGAQNISYLSLNTATAPEVALEANPATAAAVRDAFADSFNSAFRQTLAGYAQDGVIVHYLDGELLASQVSNNLSTYGFTSLVCPANSTCIASSDAARNYLFYLDGLHLTSHGFEVVAQYVATQLQAPLTLQATSDNALDTAQQWGRTLTTRMDLSSPRDGDQPEGVHAYLVGDTSTRTVRAGQYNDQFRSSTKGITGGVEFGFGSGAAGVAVNYSRPKVNFGNDSAAIDSRSLQVGAYAGFGLAGLFGQAYVGAGRNKHDIDRAGPFGDMGAKPKGSHFVAGLKGGYLMGVGAFRIGPVVALDYARVKVDGYTETGDPVLTLTVDDIKLRSMRGSLGAEVRGDFGGNGVQFRPYAALAVEKDFKGDGRTFAFSQTTAPEIVNSYSIDDVSKKAYGRLTVGASAQILSNVGLNVAISGTGGKDQGNETSGHLGVRVGF